MAKAIIGLIGIGLAILSTPPEPAAHKPVEGKCFAPGGHRPRGRDNPLRVALPLGLETGMTREQVGAIAPALLKGPQKFPIDNVRDLVARADFDDYRQLGALALYSTHTRDRAAVRSWLEKQYGPPTWTRTYHQSVETNIAVTGGRNGAFNDILIWCVGPQKIVLNDWQESQGVMIYIYAADD